MESERLHKVMARRGAGSRRACEEFIREGRVSINGERVREMGVKIDPSACRITLDGIELTETPELTYLALHKPPGVVTTASDPQNRPTVMGLIPAPLVSRRVVPVGRLDMDSEGLLLLTNDGPLVYGLTHPRYGVDKKYEVTIDKPIGDKHIDMIKKGIKLTEGTTAPAKIVSVGGTPRGTTIVISIHEGKKRQIRRMLAALGFEVTRLVRVAFGPVRLDLSPGEWRYLTNGEILSLQDAVPH